MWSLRIIANFFALLLILPGCASLNLRLPEALAADIDTERAIQSSAALEHYMRQNANLQKIARTILIANADLCKKTRMDMGVQTAKEKQFPEDLREIAAQTLGLDKEPRVVFVRNDFAGKDKDGVRLGDQFFVDGKAVSAAKAYEAESAVIMRAGEAITQDLPPAALLCDYPVSLRYSSVINAYATGKSIIVTTGMMDFASDQELALIIGHELAHNTQSHIRKIIQNRILLAGFANATRQFESEADYAGLYYMARAGYELDGAQQFWRRLATKTIKSLNKPKSHPITPERFVRLRAAIEEIKTKQGAGQALEPNLK